jgi:hypothetical protein
VSLRSTGRSPRSKSSNALQRGKHRRASSALRHCCPHEGWRRSDRCLAGESFRRGDRDARLGKSTAIATVCHEMISVRCRSISTFLVVGGDFRSPPRNKHRQSWAARLKRALTGSRDLISSCIKKCRERLYARRQPNERDRGPRFLRRAWLRRGWLIVHDVATPRGICGPWSRTSQVGSNAGWRQYWPLIFATDGAR